MVYFSTEGVVFFSSEIYNSHVQPRLLIKNFSFRICEKFLYAQCQRTCQHCGYIAYAQKVLLQINGLNIFRTNLLIINYHPHEFCLLTHKYMQILPVNGSSLLYTCSSHANPGKTTARFSPVHFNSFLPMVVTQTKMPRPLSSRILPLF